MGSSATVCGIRRSTPVSRLAVSATVTVLLVLGAAAPAGAVNGCSDATPPAYGGGTGSALNPFRIASVAHLQALRDRVNLDGEDQEGCYFLQTADLDLGGVASWVAIGDAAAASTRRFHGVYDGGLRVIRNLTITTAVPGVEYYGLFGSVRDGAIRDLRLIGVDIDLTVTGSTDSLYVGALVAMAESSSGGATSIASVLVEGDLSVTYTGDGNVYVGGIVGRSRRGTLVDDRLAFRGSITGDVRTTDSDRSQWFNFGGLVGRTSSDSRLSLGYAAADIRVTVRPKVTGTAETPVYVGILTGSSSSSASALSELYAAGTIEVMNTSDATVFVGPIGFIEHVRDSFTDIFFLDSVPAGTYVGAAAFVANAGPGAGLAGDQVAGYPDAGAGGGLVNVLARSDAQMRQGAPATTMLTADPASGRWVYNNDPSAPDPTGKWYLVLAPGPGEYAYPVFFWEIEALAVGTTVDGPTVAAGPVLACSPTDPAVGTTVTCAVTRGDPGSEILWRASAGVGVVGTAGVRLGDDGAGTFSFVVPTAAVGQRILVELVDWTGPLDVGTVGRALPSSVRAGEGSPRRPSVPATWPAAVAVVMLGALLWRARRPAAERGMPVG
jgi:hypothetical protein